MTTETAKTKAEGAESLSTARLGARPINCDQVAWMLNAIERYLPQTQHPRVSRAREMQKYALLYELMDVAHLYFEDALAQHNGTPCDVRRFQFASKAAESEAWNIARQQAPNAKSEPTAPLLAQVGSTDGLGVAVPSAPTFEQGEKK